MANWASTSYVIEGSDEVLLRIWEALEHPDVQEGSSEGWEGNVLRALGINWEERSIISEETEGDTTVVRTGGYYMRGFISDYYWNNDEKDCIKINAEEAWGATDFHEVLERNLPVKVYYVVEEEGEEIYATNDKEGKYFPERYWVDTCIDGNYQSEYFTYESSIYKWLHNISNGRINSKEDVEEFNSDYEDSDACDENFINIHKFEIVD